MNELQQNELSAIHTILDGVVTRIRALHTALNDQATVAGSIGAALSDVTDAMDYLNDAMTAAVEAEEAAILEVEKEEIAAIDRRSNAAVRAFERLYYGTPEEQRAREEWEEAETGFDGGEFSARFLSEADYERRERAIKTVCAAFGIGPRSLENEVCAKPHREEEYERRAQDLKTQAR